MGLWLVIGEYGLTVLPGAGGLSGIFLAVDGPWGVFQDKIGVYGGVFLPWVALLSAGVCLVLSECCCGTEFLCLDYGDFHRRFLCCDSRHGVYFRTRQAFANALPSAYDDSGLWAP